MQPTSLWVYLNFQSNKKFFRDYFSNPLRLRRRHRRLPRGRFVSRAFSTPSRVSPLSLMAPVSLLPLYFLHGASLSLTSSLRHLFSTPSSPLPRPLVSSQISCIFYTTYLLLSTTVTIAHVATFPPSHFPPLCATVLPFHLATLICSAKFPEKAMISPA